MAAGRAAAVLGAGSRGHGAGGANMHKRSRMRLVGDGVSVVVVAISLGAVPGCLDEGDVTAINEQGLYVNASTMHPNAGTARVDIPVCWENPNDAPGSSAQARRTWRDDRRRAVDESWGRFARI